MNTHKKQDLKNISINLYHRGKQVYSGQLKDLPELIAEDLHADRVRLYGGNGAAIVTMNFQDLKLIVGDKIVEKPY